MRRGEMEEAHDYRGFLPSRAVDHAMARLAERQHGAVSSGQLRRLGLTEREIDYRVSVGRLRRLHRGVYAVGHGCMTSQGEVFATVLAAGDGAVAGGPSSLALWDVRDRRPGEPVYVTLTRDIRLPGVRVHRVAELRPRDVSTRRGIPVLMPAPALLECASILGARDLRRAVNEALVQKRVSIPVLVDLIARSRGRRGVARLAGILLDARPTRSELEDALVAFLRAFDFTGFETNAYVGADEVDVLWRARKIVLEADGAAFHDNPLARADDAAKQARLEARGNRVERVRWADLTARQAPTAERLRRRLG